MEWVSAISDFVLGLVGSPWVYGALYLFATIDGFFPPIPSESVIIALAALAMSSLGEPNLWLVGTAAALGAFTGDQIAYTIGKRVPLRRTRFVQGARAQAAFAWAEKALSERGASFIIAARYVPIGRVAVNMTAGGLRYPRARFTGLAAIAAVTWALYSVVLGAGAGVWLHDRPWAAVVVGVVGGAGLGWVVDKTLSRITRRRRASAADGRGGGPDDTGPDLDPPAGERRTPPVVLRESRQDRAGEPAS